MSDFPVQEGDILAGKYRVERILGAGGMGVVVAAWHEELEQRVALKFLRQEMAERTDAAERFRREARAAVRIRSEHVARVLDVGTMDGGVPYMVMEYLNGHDLSDELSRRRNLPVGEAVDYLLQATEAVAEAHASGIVHRDLKPANLFLSQRADGTPLIKVLDFGISKSIAGGSMGDLSLTRTASMIGSPLYMSPEQMKSAKTVDTRTDIWALGAIFYEMLAGQPPYLADSVPELCAKLLSDAPAPMSAFRADVPPELEQALLRCLEKDRTRRWATVADLARAIAPYGPDEARIHATRASRVLGATDISVTEPMASAPLPVGERHGGSATSDPGTTGRESAGISASGRTVDSWGRTDPRGSVQPPPRRPRWLIPAGAAALVLAGAGVMLAVHSPRATAETGAASSAVAASASPRAASSPGVRPHAAVEQPSASAATAAPDAGARPRASASAAVPGAAPAKAPARAVPRARTRPRPRPEHAKPDNGVIPAFGGRR